MKVTSKMDWSLHGDSRRVSTPRKGSKTVPDDAMSIKEIMHRFTTGKPVSDTLEREVVYDPRATFDSPDLEALARMDDNERDEYLTDLRSEIASRKEAIKASEEALKKQAERDAKKDRQFDPKDKDILRQQKGVPKAKGSPEKRRSREDEGTEDDGDRRS